MLRLPVSRIGLSLSFSAAKYSFLPKIGSHVPLATRCKPRLGLRLLNTGSKQVQHGPATMPWNEFFKLRRRRNVVGTVTSIASAVLAASLAFNYFANLVIDFNKRVMGVEIQWIYMGAIVLSGFFGWLVGPMFGNQLFKWSIGSRRHAFDKMDDIFLRHVVRNRPDPSRNNVNYNPLSDFYGEKISSIRDYRHWLREGRLFTKKSEKFL